MNPRFATAAGCLAAALLALIPATRAQDSAPGGEPVLRTIDPASLRYDYLVDGSLAQDDPAGRKFKTVQAAYAAAPAGTAEKPTVIGLKPDVYLITGSAATPGLTIRKDYITLLGLTNNRRAVVLADNRGNRMGGDADGAGSSNGYVVIVDATGFTAKNLTFLNYCNVDYEYPGDARKNLTKRSATITQAVALQASGDRHVYENVALCSRLDTMFLRTTRSYFKNVFIEGTDDFIGGGTVSYWEDCEVHFPTGSGVMLAGGVVFVNTKFTAARGLQFSKGAGRGVALINCTVPPTSGETRVAWVRGKAPPQPAVNYFTYRLKDTNGAPASIVDGSAGEPAFTYSRELSDGEVRAFNPWNLLRATPAGKVDDWDPAGAREKHESRGEGSLVFRIALTGSPASVRTGGAGATIGATVLPGRVADATITWSTESKLIALSGATGPSVVVTGQNEGGLPQFVPVKATAANGLSALAWVYVEPAYVSPPVLAHGPALTAPSGGMIAVNYDYELAGREDQSVITWYLCDDARGANAREVAVSRGNLPLKNFSLGAGDVGKFIRVGVQPKHNVSDAGPAVFATAAAPIRATDVTTNSVSPNFRNFVTATNPRYESGHWTLLGTWTSVAAENFVNGYGIRAGSQGAQLLYQQDGKFGDMQIELVMSPEKTEGSGFGSPGGSADGDRVQKSDVYIKYDPRTKNGYALRFWRTTESTKKCRFQFFRIVDGVATSLDDRQGFSGVFKPNTRLTLKVAGDRITAQGKNDVDDETLLLEGRITPNDFGGAGVAWFGTVPRGNSNVYSLFRITYAR